MDLYAIFRRNLTSPEEVAEVDRRSQAELDRRPDQLRKLRSYLFEEDDGTVGTLCLYEAIGPNAIYDHGKAADVGLDEVRKVTAIDIHRPDPERLTA